MLDKGAFDGSPIADHVEYALRKSTHDSVTLGTGSHNWPILPGIQVDRESFYRNDYMACTLLVHEWMHNFDRELSHEWKWFNEHSINDLVGPYGDGDEEFTKRWDEHKYNIKR